MSRPAKLPHEAAVEDPQARAQRALELALEVSEQSAEAVVVGVCARRHGAPRSGSGLSRPLGERLFATYSACRCQSAGRRGLAPQVERARRVRMPWAACFRRGPLRKA